MKEAMPSFGVAPSLVRLCDEIERVLEEDDSRPVYVLRLEPLSRESDEKAWWAWTRQVSSVATAVMAGATRVATFENLADFREKSYVGLDIAPS